MFAGNSVPNRPESVLSTTTRPDECNAAADTGNGNVPHDTDESHVGAPVV